MKTGDNHRSRIECAIDDAKKDIAPWADSAKAEVAKLELFNKEENKSRVRSFDSQAKLDEAKLNSICLQSAKLMRAKSEKRTFVPDGKKVLLLDKYYSANADFENYDSAIAVAKMADLPKYFMAEISWMLTAQEIRGESNVSNKSSLQASAANWLRKTEVTSECDDFRSPIEIMADMVRKVPSGIRVSAQVPRIPKASFKVACEVGTRLGDPNFHIVFEPKWNIDQWNSEPIDRIWKVVSAVLPTLVFSAFVHTMIDPIVRATGFLQHIAGITWSCWYPLVAPAFVLGALFIGLMGAGLLAGWIAFSMIIFDCTKECFRRFAMACLTLSLCKRRKAYLVMTAEGAQYKLAEWRI